MVKYYKVCIHEGEMDALLNIDDLRELSNDKNIAITKHAKNRLVERGIGIEDIKNAIKTGEIIEQYENDTPFPSCLVLGVSERNSSIHVVASIDSGTLYIITTYFPSEIDWMDDFKTRKR
jgi:hypothetical protein